MMTPELIATYRKYANTFREYSPTLAASLERVLDEYEALICEMRDGIGAKDEEIGRLMGVLESIASDDNAGVKPPHDCYDAVRFRAYQALTAREGRTG